MRLFKTGITASALSFLLTAALTAEEQKTSNQTDQCGITDLPYRITARHIEPKGIGYNQGYTTLEGFFSLYNGWDNWTPFLDVRGHVFNNGNPAINAGLGMRYLAKNRIWGVNSYYDYRNTKHRHYNQAALGLESLGSIWDFRLNGYLPVGKKQSSKYDLEFRRFEGHTAILRQKYEYALAGFNAETGAHVDCWKSFPLYFAAGPYYLTGKGNSAWGGQARASITIFNYLKLEGNTSYDNLFSWIGQGQVGLNFSFGGKKKVSKQKNGRCSTSLAKRRYQSVDRFEIIPVDKKHTESVATDPATGLPYQFIFVDNTSASHGTYESPYHALVDAETNSSPYDIIYIFPGNGTTTGLDQGITLQDYQKLWGSGVKQTLVTSSGSVTIPAQSSGTYNGVVIAPMITNSSGSVVTVGNGNEISGLFLSNQGSNDCITSVDGHNLTVLNSTLAAANAPGFIGINASGLSGTLVVSECTINQASKGILLENSSTNLTANISDTDFSSSGGVNAAVHWVLTGAAKGNLNVDSCTAVTRNNAIEVDLSDTSSIVAAINSNTFTTGSYGVYLNSISGNTSIDADIQSNNMTTYYQSVWVAQTGSAVINLERNDLFATSQPTFQIDSNTGSSVAKLTITHNIFITNNDDNVYLNHSDGDLIASITSNTFKGLEYNNGIHSSITSDANTHAVTISKNTILSGNNGIQIDQSAGSASVTIHDNAMSGLYDSCGVYWNMQDTPVSSSLAMNDNIINAYDGISIYQNTSCELDVVLNNNNIDATGGGVNFRIFNESVNNISMSGNTISGFAPIELQHNIGSINASINNNTITAAGNWALYYNANSSGSITEGAVNIDNNTIISGGLGGSSGSAVYLYLHATGPITTNLTNNILNGDARAVILDLSGATHTMNLSNNIVPSGGGYSLTAASGTAYWMVNGNEFTALNSTAVEAVAMGGDVCMQLNNNTAYPVLNAYVLTAGGGTLTVNTPEGNIGEITETGTTSGPCP
jgi:trimeric autotransporter adhesin